MKLRNSHTFCRRFSALSESLISRAVEIQSPLSLRGVVNRIKTGPLECVQPGDQLESIRVSFLHRSCAAEFIKQLEPVKGLQARFVESSPLFAGIISALHLHGASRSLRVFARKPFETKGLELAPKKYGALEGFPDYRSVRDSLPFVTCHYMDIADAIRAFGVFNHPPGDDRVGHARYMKDRCDIPNHYWRPIFTLKKRPPRDDSEDSELVKDTDNSVKLSKRKVVLHGIAPGTTRDDLEAALGKIGSIQNLALVEEKDQAIVSFMSPDVAYRFLESPALHVINKRRVGVERDDNSAPVNSRLSFAWQLGLSRTIQLRAHGKPEALIARLGSQLGVTEVALKDRLHRDFQAFGHINQLQFDKENHIINITFADIYRASRAINYLAWPDDYPVKNFDYVPYRRMAVSYAPSPTSYLLEDVIKPDDIGPVVVSASGRGPQFYKPRERRPEQQRRERNRPTMSMKVLGKMVEESFRPLGSAP